MTRVLPAPRPPHPPGTVSVTLRDGGVATLRPMRAGESGPLTEVFAGMSHGSRAMRYLIAIPRMTAQLVAALTDLDGERHVAWLARVDGHPAGIARYIRSTDDPSSAEFAFEVVDAHHGRGLATALMDALTTAASVHGVRTIRGTLLPTNHASRRLVTRLGAVPRLEDRLLEAEGPLQLLDNAVVDRRAVVRLACADAADRIESRDA